MSSQDRRVALTVHDNVTRKRAARRAAAGTDKIWVDPDQVAAVLPRASYTTLLIGGTYVHVQEEFQQVMTWLRPSSCAARR